LGLVQFILRQSLSSGPYRSYSYGKYRIGFMHRASREFAGMSEKSRLIIQALKALGNDLVDDDVLHRLASMMSSQEKEDLVEETKYASAWIRETAMNLRGF
jgi:hypothetical protein